MIIMRNKTKYKFLQSKLIYNRSLQEIIYLFKSFNFIFKVKLPYKFTLLAEKCVDVYGIITV